MASVVDRRTDRGDTGGDEAVDGDGVKWESELSEDEDGMVAPPPR